VGSQFNIPEEVGKQFIELEARGKRIPIPTARPQKRKVNSPPMMSRAASMELRLET
jgi:hypothetical protein